MPGTSVQKCIDVTYTGNIDPLLVKIYATAPPTGTLGTYLNLTIDVGDDTTDAFGSCTTFGGGVNGSTNVHTGTLAGFASDHPDYAGKVHHLGPHRHGAGQDLPFHRLGAGQPLRRGAHLDLRILVGTRTS
ncbi:MAG: hypothetical protein M3P89_11020 [Actinomycetota bacterium]|nr:hypothetical protein [Actinomycetota bacterium]